MWILTCTVGVLGSPVRLQFSIRFSISLSFSAVFRANSTSAASCSSPAKNTFTSFLWSSIITWGEHCWKIVTSSCRGPHKSQISSFHWLPSYSKCKHVSPGGRPWGLWGRENVSVPAGSSGWWWEEPCSQWKPSSGPVDQNRRSNRKSKLMNNAWFLYSWIFCKKLQRTTIWVVLAHLWHHLLLCCMQDSFCHGGHSLLLLWLFPYNTPSCARHGLQLHLLEAQHIESLT